MKRRRGLFITLEGPDGCGKTTQSKLLAGSLRAAGLPVLHTREPGGTVFAENLREIILNPDYRISPLAEILLYEAGRAQHSEEVIRPALKAGNVVICERYADATVAYQGYGRGLDLAVVRDLNRIATGGLQPDLTVVLDVSPRIGLKRAAKERAHDRLEREGRAFQERVRKGYSDLAKREPGRIRVVPAAGPIEGVRRRVWELVEKKCFKRS